VRTPTCAGGGVRSALAGIGAYARAGELPTRAEARQPVVAGALASLLLGANLAAPLYAVYRERFGFNSLVLTLVFVVYALALAPSLLLFGELSDRVGRRPVILGGLVMGRSRSSSSPWRRASRGCSRRGSCRACRWAWRAAPRRALSWSSIRRRTAVTPRALLATLGGGARRRS
jgi:hypothetical protein